MPTHPSRWRVVLTLLISLLAPMNFADGRSERVWSSGTVMPTQHRTVAAEPGRRANRQSIEADSGSHLTASTEGAAHLFPTPTSPGRACSLRVSTVHVPVLMYHRIAPPSERGHDLPELVLDPQRFDAQLAALWTHGWQTITSSELAAAIDARVPVPAKTFVITLDDGHADGYTHALPILAKYGFVATFFVITGRIDRQGRLTWADLGEMQAAGMEIGNHTVGHVSEAGYSRAQTDAQVVGAQAAISTHLGVLPSSFAYPYGRMPPNLVASVKAAGIKVAYTTVRGATESAGTAYLLPRVRVSATTSASGVLWLVRHSGPGPAADGTADTPGRCHPSTECASIVACPSIHSLGPREGRSRRRPA